MSFSTVLFQCKSHVEDHCKNKLYNKIYEKTLIEITTEAINRVVGNKEEIFEHLKKVLAKAFKVVQTSTKDQVPLKTDGSGRLRKKLDEEKKSYFESWRNAPTEEMREYFYEKIQEITIKIAEENKRAKSEIDKDLVMVDEDIPLDQLVENAIKSIDKLRYVDEINRDIVESFVHRITIYRDGKVHIVLKSGNSFETPIEVENGENRPKKSIQLTKSLFFRENVVKMCKCRMHDSHLYDRGLNIVVFEEIFALKTQETIDES